MQLVTGIIVFLVMLTLLVSIHELGHLMVAKKAGVYCYEYSIGMGPCLYQRKGKPDPETRKTWLDKLWKETDFSIRLLPIGGYVKMAGEDDESSDISLKEYTEGKSLNDKGIWKQTAVMVAGVVMNFILAGVLFFTFNMVSPVIIQNDAKPVVTDVVEGKPADLAGLKAGDEIIKIVNGNDMVEPQTQSEVSDFIQYHPSESSFTIKRNNKTLILKIKPEKTKYGYQLGYYAKQTVVENPTTKQRLEQSVSDFSNTTSSMVGSVGQLATGKGYENLSGPIAIADLVIDMVAKKSSMMLYLTAVISMNLGVFNLLPIPALDGGRIALLWLDKLFKGKLNQNIINIVIGFSFLALIVLMVVVAGKDIMGLFL